MEWINHILKTQDIKIGIKRPKEDKKTPPAPTTLDRFRQNQAAKRQSPAGFVAASEMHKPVLSPSKQLQKPFACPKKQKKDDNKLSSSIEDEIITRNPGVQWSDIAGLEFAKKAVYESVVWPLLRPDIFTGIRAPPKGLLLFGPPGTGKTMIGKAIASEANATFFNISASSITSKWVGEGEKLVRTLFELAAKHQPSVIFVDEIDSLLSARSDNEQEGSRRVKTEFLVQIDGAGTNSEDRVLIIGATNRPQELDEAIIRRLAKRMYIPLPNADGRRQLISILIQKMKNSLSPEDIEWIVTHTKGFSGSDIKLLCTESSLNPLRSLDIRSVEVHNIPPISKEDFQEALRVVKSSVNAKDIGSLLEWNEHYGSFQFDLNGLDN